jgi:hypothetical protein
MSEHEITEIDNWWKELRKMNVGNDIFSSENPCVDGSIPFLGATKF